MPYPPALPKPFFLLLLCRRGRRRFSTHTHPPTLHPRPHGWDPPPQPPIPTTLFKPPRSSGPHTQGDATYLSLIRSHSGDIPSLLSLLRHMRRSLPARPNPFPEYLFFPIFRSFSEDPTLALHLFDTMLPNFGCSPTVKSLNSALSAVSLRRPDLAYEFYRKAVRQYRSISANVLTFNLLIRAAVRCGKADDGMGLMREMGRKGLRADAYSYSTVIDGLCRQGRTEDAMGLLDEMQA